MKKLELNRFRRKRGREDTVQIKDGQPQSSKAKWLGEKTKPINQKHRQHSCRGSKTSGS